MLRCLITAFAIGVPSLDAVGYAQITIQPLCCQPGGFYDLGNITSDGSGGRRALVRPLADGETPDRYTFFGEFLPELGSYSEPPATVAQDDVPLTAGEQLVLTLPQLSHFPAHAVVSVVHEAMGSDILVDTSLHFSGSITAWLAPPHEYVHDLGVFEPGDYRLTLNLQTSSALIPGEPSVTTGYIEFTVQPVPEPTTGLIAVVAFSLAAGFGPRLGRSTG